MRVGSHQEAVEAEQHAKEKQALQLVGHIHQGVVPADVALKRLIAT